MLQNGKVGNEEMRRVCKLNAVIIDEDEWMDDLDGSSKSKRILRELYTAVFPEARTVGSNSNTTPYLDSLIHMFITTAQHLNYIKELVGDFGGSEMESIDISWANEYDKLDDYYSKYMPVSHEGNVGMGKGGAKGPAPTEFVKPQPQARINHDPTRDQGTPAPNPGQPYPNNNQSYQQPNQPYPEAQQEPAEELTMEERMKNLMSRGAPPPGTQIDPQVYAQQQYQQQLQQQYQQTMYGQQPQMQPQYQQPYLSPQQMPLQPGQPPMYGQQPPMQPMYGQQPPGQMSPQQYQEMLRQQQMYGQPQQYQQPTLDFGPRGNAEYSRSMAPRNPGGFTSPRNF